MTSMAVLPVNESREYICLLTTSRKENGGAGVPSGSMTDAMAMVPPDVIDQPRRSL
jgi:hypothetical protein